MRRIRPGSAANCHIASAHHTPVPVNEIVHLNHPTAIDPTLPVGSFWADSAPPARSDFAPLAGDQACDIAVIGGGYTGLSAALHLARDHGVDVRVLEAGAPGWAASGRNGGFCCIGGTKLSYQEMIRNYGVDETRRFFTVQRESVDLVRDLAESEDLEIQATGQGELALAHKPNRIKDFVDEHDFLAATFGFKTTLLNSEELRQRGWQAANVHGGHWVPVGFGLHPLLYARGLADAAVERGAVVHGSSAVTGWEPRGGRHRLVTAGGSITADKVIVATNGYTPEHLHAGLHGRTLPVLTNIIVTRPLTEDERAAQGWTDTTPSVDTLKLLHYFRLLPDGRFLFGGRGGLDARPEAADGMKAKLTREFAAMFPTWRDAEITHFWRGFVNMAADWVPHAGLLPGETTVYIGLAYHGSGVAMGTWTGYALAGLAAGTTKPTDLPAMMARPLPRYPLPALRPWYLRAAYMTYGFKDRWL